MPGDRCSAPAPLLGPGVGVELKSSTVSAKVGDDDHLQGNDRLLDELTPADAGSLKWNAHWASSWASAASAHDTLETVCLLALVSARAEAASARVDPLPG
eukprot:13190413-Alexandrium_andersonii.AAC.1